MVRPPMAEPVHIVLPLPAVGGMEKRLAGLFLHLAARGEDVRLVAPRALADALTAAGEFAALTDLRDRLDLLEGEPSFGRLRAHVAALLTRAPAGVFHYCLASPLRLHASRSKRLLFTIPNASLAQYNWRGLAEVYGGIMRASRVDVLDPSVHRQLAERFFWRRGSFSLTPGSWVDLERFAPLRGTEKEDAIAFLGLLSHEKQAPRLIDCIPDLLRALDAAGLGDTQIWLMGRDADTDVTARVAALGDPRVRAWSEPSPARVLSRAKVFLSLQRSTNHPSKSLLEAMACGCSPVVTDTRDSRRSAPDALARYVPRDFDARHLAEACIPLLRRPPEDIDAHAAKMRAVLAECFSIDTMASYYRGLYEQLRAL